MERRELFAGLGYSLIVLAGDSFGAQDSPTALDRIRRDVDRLAPPAAAPGAVLAEPNMCLVEMETDFLVAGGGLAGVCAAISAARHGLQVVLVQDRSRLGGNASSEVKLHALGANAHKSRPGWREGGWLEELRLYDAANNPQRSFEVWDLHIYDKVVSEPNITLLLDSTLYAAETRGGLIERAMVRCDKSEHLYRIKARLFCDATGDGRLALEAGAETRWGQEPRSEFNEPLAPEKPTRATQGSSILFSSRKYDQPMPFAAPAWARKVTREQLRFRGTNAWEWGYWWVEWGGHRDTVRDHERIRFELLAITLGVWDYIKNGGDHPRSVNWAMDWIGMFPGRRESRRIVGDYIFNQHDILRGDIEDAVAIGGWPMDDHPPEGFDRPDLHPCVQILPPDAFNIPLRSLYSKNVRNLMMAGRNISASHVAFSSTRVMGTGAVEGQAVGVAAAVCLQHGILPRQIYEQKDRLEELQQALLRDDQSIKNHRNQDPLDVARKARVRASSENGETMAANIIDGYVRDIPKGQVHHWAGEMNADGAWIELSWDSPQRIREVQITFDTAFHRELTLSLQETVMKGIVYGAQPETVRDYSVTYRKKGSEGLAPLAEVRGNYLRLRRHNFEPVEAEAIRIQITATNGDPLARIFEVRCYG